MCITDSKQFSDFIGFMGPYEDAFVLGRVLAACAAEVADCPHIIGENGRYVRSIVENDHSSLALGHKFRRFL
jgi:hypothetical protein